MCSFSASAVGLAEVGVCLELGAVVAAAFSSPIARKITPTMAKSPTAMSPAIISMLIIKKHLSLSVVEVPGYPQ